MYLASGDVHECDFRSGRAHGKGTYVTAKGSELKGAWDMNKRTGTFEVLDSSGKHHTETYGTDGKLIARKPVKEVQPNPKYEPGGAEPETIEVDPAPGEKAKKVWEGRGWGVNEIRSPFLLPLLAVLELQPPLAPTQQPRLGMQVRRGS